MMKIHPTAIIDKNVRIGEGVYIGPFSLIESGVILKKGCKIFGYSHLYECEIGASTQIGPFTEIQKGVLIDKNCKVQSHSFICEEVKIGRGVFIGHNVTFINDRSPQAVNQRGELLKEKEWKLLKTIIEDNASLGSGSIILPVKVEKYALVGAGTIVTKNVPKHAVVYGIPAKIKGIRCFCNSIIRLTDLSKSDGSIQCPKCREKIILK